MATILLLDPSEEIEELYSRAICALGHTVVLSEPARVDDIDALVLEPASPPALAIARKLRAARPELPMICASILPRDARAIALDPEAYLEKPFPLSRLRLALEQALARVM